jgi:hypothetical protein
MITVPNGHKIYQHLQLQDPPKIYPNWDFWVSKITIWQPWRGHNLMGSSRLKKIEKEC